MNAREILNSIVNTPVQTTPEGIYSSFEKVPKSSYDVKARAYEWMVRQRGYNKLMWGTTPDDYTKFAEKSLSNEYQLGLDIGCGGLSQTDKLYSNIKHPFVVLDYSMKMLQLGQKRIVNNNGSLPANLLFMQADAFMLPFKSNSFDLVVSFGMVHMFDKKKEYIKEALRVLKPGGSFHFSVLTTDRRISKKYLNYLYKNKEVGIPMSSSEILDLFAPFAQNMTHYMKGSMLFVGGSS